MFVDDPEWTAPIAGNVTGAPSVAGRMYTIEDTSDIFYGEHGDFDDEPVEAIEGDTGRWARWETRIYKHTASGEFWSVDVGMALTEIQTHDAPVRVERREMKTRATSVSVTLPTGAGPLADFLATEGHLEAAQAVRGLVLSWERRADLGGRECDRAAAVDPA